MRHPTVLSAPSTVARLGTPSSVHRHPRPVRTATSRHPLPHTIAPRALATALSASPSSPSSSRSSLSLGCSPCPTSLVGLSCPPHYSISSFLLRCLLNRPAPSLRGSPPPWHHRPSSWIRPVPCLPRCPLLTPPIGRAWPLQRMPHQWVSRRVSEPRSGSPAPCGPPATCAPPAACGPPATCSLSAAGSPPVLCGPLQRAAP